LFDNNVGTNYFYMMNKYLGQAFDSQNIYLETKVAIVRPNSSWHIIEDGVCTQISEYQGVEIKPCNPQVVMELTADQCSPTYYEARSQQSGHLVRVFPTLLALRYVDVHLLVQWKDLDQYHHVYEHAKDLLARSDQKLA
jgi:hypothetical protein